MKIIHRSLLLALLLIFGLTLAYFSSCKKIDLKRIAVIDTETVENVTASTTIANGSVVDAGSNPTDHGFCWSEGSDPTINNNTKSAGNAINTGDFNLLISGLQHETNYNIRSYIVDDAGVTYGDTESFKTLGEIPNQWLHYDDGENFDGIGYTVGGSFDVAIRFPKEAIQEYAGGVISKIRFFPYEGAPTAYSVTVWEGDPPVLKVLEYVSNPNIGSWTEVTLPVSHPINTNEDIWIGYWVEDSPADTYPAGVDNGPAMTGFGDLISNDDGLSWAALSELDPPNLNYNWNLQAFVENTKGETAVLSRSQIELKLQKQRSSEPFTRSMIRSKKQSKN